MHQISNANYPQSHQSGHTGSNGFYAPQPQSSYSGPVYYGVGQGGDIGQQMALENRRRGFDAINDFFGDAKRRQFDPSSYPQVGQRLMALHGIPIQGGTLVDYMPAPPMVAVGSNGHSSGPSMPQSHYVLPMPNLRTKSDLVNIDNFLDQMQSTVYESSNAASAAGVHHPVGHYTTHGASIRQSHSPPQATSHNATSSSGAQGSTATASRAKSAASSHSPQAGTPALTPTSYTSGQSPNSVPGLSPSSRHNAAASATYPILPAVSSGYLPHPSGAPVSTLGTNFDSDPRHRYSGGMLQKAAGISSVTEETEASDDTPSSPPEKSPDPSAPAIDPSLSDESSTGDNSESARDRAQEIWVENIRVIEALRKFISDRLENHQYEGDGDGRDVDMAEGQAKENKPAPPPVKAEIKVERENLYPVLRAAIDSTS